MKSRLCAVLALSLATLGSAFAQNWAPVGDRIKTEWAEQVTPENVHKEYPRPQMVRPEWKSLNGLWEYSITPKNAAEPSEYEGNILVPFAVESSLSGVGRALTPEDALWYRTTFKVPSAWKGKRLALNFEAVDWQADVYVNDIQVGRHTGGYTHFSFDITPYLKNGENSLAVRVLDATDNDFQPRGKQVKNPKGVWYTAVSGIWQSVWIEPVAKAHVSDYYAVADIKSGTVDVTVSADGTQEGDIVRVALLDGGVGYSTENPSSKILAQGMTVPGGTVTLPVGDVRLWSPDSPYLYGLKVSIVRGGKVLDSVDGYTAMREITLYYKNKNTKLMALNGQPLFQFGPLDQGWWPDGLYTAPTDEALKYDIVKTKDFGFNMIRKHIKVEPSRWFYYCDQLGMLVWQDMPCFGSNNLNKWGRHSYNEGTDFPATPQAKANYYKEWKEIIAQVKKFPCVVMWIPFNEAWSQFDTKAVVEFTRAQDQTRLINMSSGGSWEPDCGDVLDNHHYPYPAMYFWEPKMATVLGEYGGICLPVKDHLWQTDRNWGYVQYKSGDEVLDVYEEYADQLILLVKQGVCGAVYTQTTDVEGEVNGLMTYDRKVIKLDEKRLREINTKVIDSMPLK